jgi:hypothetical protein
MSNSTYVQQIGTHRSKRVAAIVAAALALAVAAPSVATGHIGGIARMPGSGCGGSGC